ncbi:hypothetical protein ABENE_07670 [Asticcacaulis benevestitus DSM 16100 = ATCC BAA-896]|uniref:Uncharacterized protein n=1 Tax=Asticcacaulis benevestitus DSM 16100 = ATCC BAA-896 TaxID=1121022 RepID=V4Q4E4_9CAUL|nr:hypothetical protein [Asticcacaulis benevestitus]ESQ92690.1 hypothetical protein ABENE_07670 [Asticcacaulis benevestitus DSM 16100 = ATCC BAA-896]
MLCLDQELLRPAMQDDVDSAIGTIGPQLAIEAVFGEGVSDNPLETLPGDRSQHYAQTGRVRQNPDPTLLEPARQPYEP